LGRIFESVHPEASGSNRVCAARGKSRQMSARYFIVKY
jgi:hypothetical protein